MKQLPNTKKNCPKNGEKVLVLGEDTRSFLTVVRSLGRKDIIVHVAGDYNDDISLYSKYIKKVFKMPPYSDVEEYVLTLIKIIQSERYDFVIPTNDKNLIPLQMFESKFKKLKNIYLLNEKSFNYTNNKLLTYELANQLGINVPRYRAVSKSNINNGILTELLFPQFLKPICSFTIDNLLDKSKVFQIDSIEQLMRIINTSDPNNCFILQENFDGTGVGLEVLALNGEILVSFQHIRIHEPIGGGGSSYRKSLTIDEELLDAAKKILTELNYTGVAMLEFKIDPSTKKWALIEINGRFWGSLPLAVAAGADFPYYLFQMLRYNKREFPKGYLVNTYCRNTSSDLSYIISNFGRERNIKNKLNFLLLLIPDFCNILFLRESNDTLVIDDPIPGLIEIKKLLQILLLEIKIKINFPVEFSNPLKKYRSKKLKNKIYGAKTILFICKGNICRSPFAECYARRVLPAHIKVYSSGTLPIQGRRSPPEAIEAAKLFGIDLLNHRSNIVNDELVKNADIIFIFDIDNKYQLRKKCKLTNDNVFYLSDICPKSQGYISDPYGKDVCEFENTYKKIKSCIDNLSTSLIFPP